MYADVMSIDEKWAKRWSTLSAYMMFCPKKSRFSHLLKTPGTVPNEQPARMLEVVSRQAVAHVTGARTMRSQPWVH